MIQFWLADAVFWILRDALRDTTCFFLVRMTDHAIKALLCTGISGEVPQDHFTPVGQFIDKTAIPDPHNLELFCEVNGVQRQRGSTGEMIFKLPKLILIRELAESACVCLLLRVPCFRLVERETKKRTPMGSSYLDTHTCTFLIWIKVLQVQA